MFLGQVRLPAEARRAPGAGGARPPGALFPGAYAEVELRAKQIGWKGRADLLVLSEERCEIIDFKTGVEDDGHRFQVQVYALIWSRDERLNPSHRLADRLTLAYQGRGVQVGAPSAAQLEVLEHDLGARREAVRQAVSGRPPEARPTPENCGYCGVRHLCDEYWTEETQRALESARLAEDTPFHDMELTITDRHGPLSWNAIVELSPWVATGRRAVVRTAEGAPAFRAGQRNRILDAHAPPVQDDDAQPVVVTMGSLSEAYTVS